MIQHRPTRFQTKGNPCPMEWEIRELKRLIWAILLFLTAFLGKQIYPERILDVGEEIVAILSTSVDPEELFSELGSSLDDPKGILYGVGDFCVEVFGPHTEQVTRQSSVLPPIVPSSGVGLMNSNSVHTVLYAKLLPTDPPTEDIVAPETPVIPAVGTVLITGEPQPHELPDGYTVNKLSFGDLQTVVPVMGQLTSGFGYRDHPVNGRYLFHGGVDIGANLGTPVAAFADGKVEYIGEDSSYGLYLQIDHGAGIKSFYAHCKSVCVKKGQYVTAGETVAQVGSTGVSTGPHLHLELKCGQLRVDPAYYLEFSS